MGNRAVVVFKEGEQLAAPIYLHWNGGPETIYPVLNLMRDVYKVRADLEYCPARFVQIMGNFFGGSASLGIMPSLDPANPDWDRLDPGDNGIYLVDVGSMRVVGRPSVKTADAAALAAYLAAEEKAALAHDYNKPKPHPNTGEIPPTITARLREKNDQFFLENGSPRL